jgi:hypothetical protein
MTRIKIEPISQEQEREIQAKIHYGQAYVTVCNLPNSVIRYFLKYLIRLQAKGHHHLYNCATAEELQEFIDNVQDILDERT